MSKQEFKIILCGSAGAGKTAAIKTVNQLQPMTATDDRGLLTTVGMDYGEMTLDETLVLRLYGTSGEEPSSLWKLMERDAAGFIMLVDNRQKQPMSGLGKLLDYFNFRIRKTPVVIGVTHTDKSATPEISDYEKFLKSRKEEFPVFPVDARSREDVLMLINNLFSLIGDKT